MSKKNSKVEVVKVSHDNRHNRSRGHGTINQDRSFRNRARWEDIGGDEPIGVLRDRKGNTIKRGKNNRWEPLTAKQADYYLNQVIGRASSKAA